MPTCPSCGSSDGILGTSNAYFVCHNPACPHKAKYGHAEVYWLGDGQHPEWQGQTWKDAVLASPYGRSGSGAHYFDE